MTTDATRETFTVSEAGRLRGSKRHRNAESGLREIESGYPDAVILDLRMPFINGLGFCIACAPSTSWQDPVVVVTATSCLDDLRACRTYAIWGRLRFKPLWIEDLVDVAHSLLEARSNQRGLLIARPSTE